MEIQHFPLILCINLHFIENSVSNEHNLQNIYIVFPGLSVEFPEVSSRVLH